MAPASWPWRPTNWFRGTLTLGAMEMAMAMAMTQLLAGRRPPVAGRVHLAARPVSWRQRLAVKDVRVAACRCQHGQRGPAGGVVRQGVLPVQARILKLSPTPATDLRPQRPRSG